MNRKANVFFKNEKAGIIYETDNGYLFVYDKAYYERDVSQSISLTLPKTKINYESKVLFAFFDGLIPEGWLLELAQENWKLKTNDRFGLLLACCKNCIGAVSIEEEK